MKAPDLLKDKSKIGELLLKLAMSDDPYGFDANKRGSEGAAGGGLDPGAFRGKSSRFPANDVPKGEARMIPYVDPKRSPLEIAKDPQTKVNEAARIIMQNRRVLHPGANENNSWSQSHRPLPAWLRWLGINRE